MSTDERESAAAVSVSDESGESELDAQKPKRKLDIAVNITDVGPCKKHLKITIPREEIDRQYEESLDNLRKEALVPGFRMGRAPRQLVVKRFKKQVSDQVKSSLLMSSLEQIDEDYKLDPITQPRLDVEAIEIPEKGPMNFEMDVEVRPQFDVPNYTGLKVKRPVAEVNDQHVEEQLTRVLERQGQIVPKLEGAAEPGDYLTADITFVRPDGQPMSEFKEVQFRLKPELRFQDGSIPDSSPLLGAKPGDTRELFAKLGSCGHRHHVAGNDGDGSSRCQRSEATADSRIESSIPRLDQFRHRGRPASGRAREPGTPDQERAASGDPPPASRSTALAYSL